MDYSMDQTQHPTGIQSNLSSDIQELREVLRAKCDSLFSKKETKIAQNELHGSTFTNLTEKSCQKNMSPNQNSYPTLELNDLCLSNVK